MEEESETGNSFGLDKLQFSGGTPIGCPEQRRVRIRDTD
jgi:hypothetical protein